MNIKFENVLNLAMENIKTNWLSTIGYGLLMTVLILAFGFGFGIVLAIIFLLGALGGSAVGFVIAFIFIILLLIVLGLPLMLISSASNYIVARTLIYEQGLFANIKKIATFNNIGQYFIRVLLPVLGITLIYIFLTIISTLINEGFGLLMALLLILPYFAALVYVVSFFQMALYVGPEVKTSWAQINQQFTRKQIFSAYMIPFTMMLMLNIVTSMLGLIPFVGIVIGAILSALFAPSIDKAMIMEVNGLGEKKSPTTTANAVIKSDSLTVVINNYGAQITSVKKGDEEIMWQADPQYWGRTSPVLFPFVGKLKDNKYQAGGNVIEMNQHGFLRDRTFKIASQDQNSVTFEYTSTLADFNIYPVDFTVQITYRVFGSRVTTEYKVINNSSYPMPYQIGAHPAFNVNSVDDLEAVFKPQTVTKHYFRDGLQSMTESFDLDTVKLSYDLINDNIPCYSDFTDKTLILRNNGQDFLKFDFSSMKYLAIWSPEYKNAKFVCIEPWNGICSKIDQDGYLVENKDGMNTLAANSSEVCSYSFEVC